MNHTKEPWSQGDIIKELIFSESVESVITKCMKMDESEDGDQEANAQRIVACVNACAGITNEALEKGIVLSSVEKECWKWMHDNNLRYKDGSERDFEWHGVKVWEDV